MIRNPQEFIAELNQAIDFHTVLNQIAKYASFSCSQQEILQTMPTFDRLEVLSTLSYVKEAMIFLQKGHTCSMAGVSDITPYTKQAKKSMTLLARDLLAVASFLVAVRTIQNTFEYEYTPQLDELAKTMNPCTKLIQEIQKKIDLTGSVKEDASALLKQKNKQLVNAKVELSEYSKNFVKRHASQLMENMTTQVQGRVCILVKAQDKNSFGGMIHASSQSGLAFYVEPQEFVNRNNQIQTLHAEIEEEKKRICKELSSMVKQSAFTIESDLETMIVLDVTLAKAMWGYSLDGCVPMIQTRDHAFRFTNARHPLIDSKKVVANTYVCDANQYCLMISGPNMGGKTVTLKTIGLFMVLAHCGFPVIAHEAMVPWYDSMWFDIGDNQSIENNLSTFSSHISKISQICQNSDANTFVLLDEVGNGTDPLEGASLASAVIEYLIGQRCTLITSTHYSQVKTFGKSNRHVLVSSVEFDSETLKPTYRYLPGISGASYAFSIAREFSLRDEIIDRAMQIKEENVMQNQRELEKLEAMQNEVLKKQDRFDALIQDAHRIQKEAQDMKKEWEVKKAKLDAEYEEKLASMLEEKKEEARAIIAELKKQKQGKQHEQIDLLHQIRELAPEQMEEVQESYAFKVGDYVKLTNLNSHGEIVDLRKNKATVLANGMKLNVKVSQLEPMHRPRVQKSVRKAHVDKVFTRFPLELNLIGMRVEEGLQALDHYLDQAVVHHASQVRIIHGMGTGKLRSAVWSDLKKHRQVKSYTSASPSDGGLGATIVILK